MSSWTLAASIDAFIHRLCRSSSRRMLQFVMCFSPMGSVLSFLCMVSFSKVVLCLFRLFLSNSVFETKHGGEWGFCELFWL